MGTSFYFADPGNLAGGDRNFYQIARAKAHLHSHKLPFPRSESISKFFNLKKGFVLFCLRIRTEGKAFLSTSPSEAGEEHVKAPIIRLICLIDILAYVRMAMITIYQGLHSAESFDWIDSLVFSSHFLQVNAQMKISSWEPKGTEGVLSFHHRQVFAMVKCFHRTRHRDTHWIIHAQAGAVNGKLFASSC